MNGCSPVSCTCIVFPFFVFHSFSITMFFHSTSVECREHVWLRLCFFIVIVWFCIVIAWLFIIIAWFCMVLALFFIIIALFVMVVACFFIVILHFWHTKINISFVTSPTQFQDLYEMQKWLWIFLHIHGHPWNALAENTHQHGMGGGTGVPRVCWSIFAQTSELTKKITKNYKRTANQHCVASSAAQFQYVYESSMFLQRCAANSTTKASALT